MSCTKDQPLFYTLSHTNCYDGSTHVIGIFDSMRALGYRLQRIHTTCGDEYHIDCLHLWDINYEKGELIEQETSRAKYQRENAIKDKLFKEHKEFIGNSNNSKEDESSKDDEQLAEEIREERLNVA